MSAVVKIRTSLFRKEFVKGLQRACIARSESLSNQDKTHGFPSGIARPKHPLVAKKMASRNHLKAIGRIWAIAR